MFKQLHNTVTIDVTLRPDGPILVRAQSVGIDPGVADMEFQRTYRDGEPTVFLAGSGLKGVLRAHCERLLNSAGRFACDPTKGKKEKTPACGYLPLGKSDGLRAHAGQCPACFTFGSLKVAGRFRVADAYPVQGMWDQTNATEVRTGVGIERKSQAAAAGGGVLYDAEVVVQGGFAARITGENFSLWQLGLVLQALRDLDAGLLQVGGCKSRGMGNVKVDDWSVEVRTLDGNRGYLAGARHSKINDYDYGLPEDDRVAIGNLAEERDEGLFRVVRYAGDAVDELVGITVARLREYLRPGG